MAKTKIIVIALIAILLVGGASAVILTQQNDVPQQNDDPPVEEKSRTFTNIFGQEFTIKGKIERSVIQSGPPLTFASYLGPNVMNTIVATGTDVKHAGGLNTYSAAYDLVPKATITQSSFLAEIEKIAGYEPDVVIVAGGNALSDPVIEFCNRLKDMGIPAFAMKSVSEVNDETFQKQLRFLGDVFGERERADMLITESTKRVGQLQTMLSKVKGAEVKYTFAGGINWGGANGFLKSTSAYTPLIYLGDKVVNVYSEITDVKSSTLDWEQLYDYERKTHKIDMLFIDSGSGYSGVVKQYNETPSKFTALSAWNDEEVYNVLPWCSRGMMPDNSIIIAYQIAYMLYPEVFDPGFDVDSFAKEIWNLFMGFECGNEVYNISVQYYNTLGLTNLLEKSPLV